MRSFFRLAKASLLVAICAFFVMGSAQAATSASDTADSGSAQADNLQSMKGKEATEPVAGAQPQPGQDEAKTALQDAEKETGQEAPKELPEQATYPGVQNILYRSGEDNEPHAIIWYPAFGNEQVDSDIKYFVSVQGADFAKDVEDSVPEGEEKPASYDLWEMTGFYTLSRPAENIVSVTFNIFSYSGGAHGNLFIRCLNYDLADGKLLELSDLFGDTEQALKIMSAWCQEKLRAELGNDLDEEMMTSGSNPDAANFLNLSLVKDGVVVEFQPYQVGPWSIGPQSVNVPLAQLLPAKPNSRIWPDQPGDK